MGGQLIKDGEIEMGRHYIRLYDVDKRYKNNILSISTDLLSFIDSSREIEFICRLLKDMIVYKQYGVDTGDQDIYDNNDIRTYNDIYKYIMNNTKDNTKVERYNTSNNKENIRDIHNKRDNSNNTRYNSNSKQNNNRDTSAKSKQFKKIDYQTYEYISRDVLPDRIIEVSEHNSSLGKDTYKDIMNWDMSKGSSIDEPIGTTLKNLINTNINKQTNNVIKYKEKNEKSSNKHHTNNDNNSNRYHNNHNESNRYIMNNIYKLDNNNTDNSNVSYNNNDSSIHIEVNQIAKRFLMKNEQNKKVDKKLSYE